MPDFVIPSDRPWLGSTADFTVPLHTILFTDFGERHLLRDWVNRPSLNGQGKVIGEAGYCGVLRAEIVATRLGDGVGESTNK